MSQSPVSEIAMGPGSGELSDAKLSELNAILAGSEREKHANAGALNGLIATSACCPDLIMPSEYLAVIQACETEEDGLTFDYMAKAERFMHTVSQHWNHVNRQLNEG
ncbi:MAG: UPF0149 family protein [Geminicoccaceae bacterium]